MAPVLDRLVCVAFWVAVSLEFSMELGRGVGGVPYSLEEARFVLGWRLVGSGCLMLELELSDNLVGGVGGVELGLS